MPVILNVTGPHQIYFGAAGNITNLLGRTDNDDLFNIDIEYQYNDIYTNEFGANPAEAIIMGAKAFVSMTMVSYDPDKLQALMNRFDGKTSPASNVFYFPKVGNLVLTNTLTTSILLDSDGAGPNYTVNNCRLISTNVKDVGNKPTRAGFKFEILPGTANGPIYTRS